MTTSKIVFCLPVFRSPKDEYSTGGTISNYTLIRELSSKHSLIVIAAIVSKDLLEVPIKNVTIITKPGFDQPSLIVKAKKKIWLYKTIKDYLKKESNVITISTNGTASFVNKYNDSDKIILVRAFEDFLNYKVVGESIVERIRKRLFYYSVNNLIKATYTEAKFIITNSKYMKLEISKYFNIPKDNIHVLYPPIDIVRKDFRNYDPKKINIGMINPKPIKGETVFLAIAEKFPDYNFSYFSKENRNYKVKNIEYLGWGNDVEKIFASFDLLIVPSLWDEPFGRVAVEGIRSGIPVLVSNHGGITETVDNAFVVKDDDVESWQRKIDWVKTKPEEVKIAWEKSAALSERFTTEAHNKQVDVYFK
ncbi:glycosyltransferase family 4 protein [Sodalis sp. RH13]|uniref:glycosyltransferase family 4 protein n=1 Tax=Sodalis sp. RH13 TaxID=3394328 RepID=UPI0039B5A1E3